MLASIKRQAGAITQGIELLEGLRELHPDNVDGLERLGGAYRSTGRTEDALEVLLDAERRNKNRFEVCLGLAGCYRELGRPAKAMDYADRAVALAPRAAPAHHARAELLRHLRRYEDAREALRIASSLDGENAQIAQDLAQVCMRLKDYTGAISQYQVVAKLTPDRWESHLHLAMLHVQLRQLDDAADAIETGLRIAPSQPQLLQLAAARPHLNSGTTPLRPACPQEVPSRC